MKTILQNWTFMRALRLVLGIAVLIQSIVQKDITIGALAGFLLFTTLANVGCCGAGGCSVNSKLFNKQQIQHDVLDEKK